MKNGVAEGVAADPHDTIVAKLFGSFYETESEIWAEWLGDYWLGSLEFSVFFKTILSSNFFTFVKEAKAKIM